MPENEKDALVEGRFAADEGDDNAIDVSNPNYIGVDPEYRNHAEYEDAPSNAPHEVEDDEKAAEIEQRAKDHGQVVDGPHGYTTKTAEAGGLTAASPYSAGAQEAASEPSPADEGGSGNEGDQTGDPWGSGQATT